MKQLKKLAAVLLAVVMTLAMNMTVFADDAPTTATSDPATYRLTLDNTAEGHTYEAYQIFTGDLSTNEKGEKVLSNVKWGTGVDYTGTELAADVAKALGDGSMTIATLEGKLTLKAPVKTVEKSSKGSTVIDGLEAGYYLVKDKDGTQKDTSDAYTKFIVQVVGDTEVAVKSDVPTVEKKVKDTNDSTGDTSKWQDSADADINDKVQYQITGTMPDNIADYTKYTYKFTDTMSKGLTYNADAKITIGEKDVTSSFTTDVTTNAKGEKVVTWSCGDLKTIKDVALTKETTVVVTYSATLNNDAVIGAAGNPNTVNLTYSNNPNKGGDGETGKTPDDKNIVFTYKTVVNKVDQSGKSLKGAAFKLEKKVKTADGTTTMQTVKEFTAGDDTTFTFTGLDDGDYKLTETTTPNGYNTIDPVEFTISAEHDKESDDPKLTKLSVDETSDEAEFTVNKDAGSLTTDIMNKKGSTLPSTGGIGTRMFYVFGGCLVAAAVVLLALKKRKEA
ncbi:MAG: isopeptide-forming domain-containing fimbrial protein [Eubacteriales bacterium]|nr:isopeptide-forming domain-containing fimbrial protein [Eubacteriales bacterium]